MGISWFLALQLNNMKVIILAAFVAVAIAAEIKPDYTAPPAAYPKEPVYPAVPYAYAYGVKDEPTYNDFDHQESSDGKVVKGSYRVALPDGRTQIVTYTADEYGYRADVKYEGEAKYPVYKAQSSRKAPVYYPKAAYPKAAYPEPAYSKPQPAYPKKAYPEPAYSKPAYPKESKTEEAYSEPEPEYSTTEAAYAEPTYPKTA